MSYLRKLRLIGTIVAAGALFPLLSQAQAYPTFATAKVPFAFQLGARLLPAGTYQFRMIAEHILEIRGETESAFLMVHSEDDHGALDKGALLFQQGDGNQLREIKAPVHGIHLYCVTPHSKALKGVAAQKPAPAQTVTVAFAEPKP